MIGVDRPREDEHRLHVEDDEEHGDQVVPDAVAIAGVGHRLDSSPELLFLLRGVDHAELIEQAIPASPTRAKGNVPTIATDELGDIFDDDIRARGPERGFRFGEPVLPLCWR